VECKIGKFGKKLLKSHETCTGCFDACDVDEPYCKEKTLSETEVMEVIEEAKKEFPCFDCVFFPYDELCEIRHEDSPCALFSCKKWFIKWFGK